MAEDKISISEIEDKTPFVVGGSGRAIPQSLIYDPGYEREGLPEYVKEQDWHLFSPNSNGELILMRSGEAIKATYFGAEAASDEDIQLSFLSFYYQHGSFPNVLEFFKSIQEDLHHLAASISKIAIYQYLSEDNELAIADYVQTELEYIFSVCRSLFDTLHQVSRESWSNIQLFEGGKNELPAKLSKMALTRYEPVSSDELVEKYGIRESFAEYYEEMATFLSSLKYYRDSVHHYGGSFDIIFRLEDGIAVSTNMEPYSEFDAWEDSQLNDNGLAPIWPFLSHIIGGTLEFMNRLPDAVFDGVLVPDEIAPGYNVYMRGPDIQNLSLLDSLATDGDWGDPVIGRIQSKVST